MCSIMTIYGRPKEVDKAISDMNVIYDILETKGGDSYEFSLLINDVLLYGEVAELAEVIYDQMLILSSDICVLHLFSRLTPEMELTNNKYSQPYVSVDPDSTSMIHGTIGAVDQIAEDLDITEDIPVDTDLFLFEDFDELVNRVNSSGGKISAIKLEIFSDFVQLKMYSNGLGLYKYSHINGASIATNINLANRKQFNYAYALDLDEIETITLSNNRITKDLSICDIRIEHPKDYVIMPLFSGGLDITCALQQDIIDVNKYDSISNIDLVYFDWFTVAAKQEIAAGAKFAEHLSNKYEAKHSVIEVPNMFKDILSAAGLNNTRLTDTDAVGAESAEAESAISYVPFRNTFLLTLAAARAEQLYPHKNVRFILGANLTEGMIYLDNSEPFILAMNNIVKLGGQACENFEVIAPFVNHTKTKMLEQARLHEFKLDTAFSCYFPNEDGSECGVCGSCILKNTALDNTKDS